MTVMALGGVLMNACKKPSAEVFVPGREFTPTSIAVSASDTAVTISWPSSVNADQGQTYTVEINQDSTFTAAADLSFVTPLIKVVVTDDSISDNTKYFVRVKANKNAAMSDSYWIADTASFTLRGKQVFKPMLRSDIIDVGVILRWVPTEGISKIRLTDEKDAEKIIDVSAGASALGVDTVYGLDPSTAYTAYLLSDAKTVGTQRFTTVASITGANLIDLRGNTDPMALLDTLPDIASGSVVVLQRGQSYTINTAYIFEKSVTIRSGLGFGSPAVLALSSNFDARGGIDSLAFMDINFKTVGATYVMNVGYAATIGKLSLLNCTTEGVYDNSLIRLKTAGDEIDELIMDGCIFDSIGIAAKYAVIYANASSSAIINHIKVTNSTFYDIFYFIRQDGVAPASLEVSSSTFDHFINQGGYFANFSGTPPPVFNITNCIFGATLDPASSNGIKTSQGPVFDGCYQTTDCVFSANPFVGVASYAGSAAALFRDPAAGDFTIKDPDFAGKNTAGDPRWR